MGKLFLVIAVIWHLLYNTMTDYRAGTAGFAVPKSSNVVFSECGAVIYHSVVYVGVAAVTDDLSTKEFAAICGIGFSAYIAAVAALGTALSVVQMAQLTASLAMICSCSIYMCHLRQRVLLLFFSDILSGNSAFWGPFWVP
uniref:Uncharacterized protein n=1 Tax=Eutreptiella gymnastica TaxID=73025 RepID=A0A7S1N517_9EUGL|mmetsp:Transcript_12056/g.21921  ORF Transcript_12056/g.21921 Transcript_12056/m.21921 type:complete len:141 (+) Transcript_12056:464-886(+)